MLIMSSLSRECTDSRTQPSPQIHLTKQILIHLISIGKLYWLREYLQKKREHFLGLVSRSRIQWSWYDFLISHEFPIGRSCTHKVGPHQCHLLYLVWLCTIFDIISWFVYKKKETPKGMWSHLACNGFYFPLHWHFIIEGVLNPTLSIQRKWTNI